MPLVLLSGLFITDIPRQSPCSLFPKGQYTKCILRVQRRPSHQYMSPSLLWVRKRYFPLPLPSFKCTSGYFHPLDPLAGRIPALLLQIDKYCIVCHAHEYGCPGIKLPERLFRHPLVPSEIRSTYFNRHKCLGRRYLPRNIVSSDALYFTFSIACLRACMKSLSNSL